MKTTAELKAHYRDVIIPMVAQYNFDRGTDVKPWECVKYNDEKTFCEHPTFTGGYNYTFALTILDGRPVFMGDTLYYRDTSFIVQGYNHTFGNCTWTPPTKKRTFVLNGVELPCPKKVELMHCNILKIQLGYHVRHFDFDAILDAAKVYEIITRLLTEARDKE